MPASAPGGPFNALLDRGCFHNISAALCPRYVENIAEAAASGAHFFLLVGSQRALHMSTGDIFAAGTDVPPYAAFIQNVFRPKFETVRVQDAWLSRGPKEGPAVHGLLFWMVRR